MVFPSLPAYLDPTNPANWQQQQRPSAITTQQHFSQPLEQPPPQPQPQPHPQPSHGSIRPGSMAERARMANIPMPETALKCPRCDSTNTKFCYFNNYNLSQPRHFCKTCRRYWTRGGALRNVPVGGGCRRNKRTKSNNNNRSSSSTNTSSNIMSTSSDVGPTSSLGSIISSFKSGLLPAAAAAAAGGGHDHMLGLGSSSSQRLVLNDFPNEINLEGLSYGAVSGPMGHFLGFEQWRFPGMTSSQLPLLGSLDISSSSFQHAAGMEQSVYGGAGSGTRIRPNMFQSSASGSASLKFENNNNNIINNNNNNDNNSNNQDLNIQFLGNEQHLWGDVSHFGSSSPNNNNAL